MSKELKKKVHRINSQVGPVFPTTVQHGLLTETIPGMSLRDWFAGMAVNGMFGHSAWEDLEPSEQASDAYNLADAMVAERKRRDSR